MTPVLVWGGCGGGFPGPARWARLPNPRAQSASLEGTRLKPLLHLASIRIKSVSWPPFFLFLIQFVQILGMVEGCSFLESDMGRVGSEVPKPKNGEGILGMKRP